MTETSWLHGYLRRFNLTPEAPSLHYLTRLIRAHLSTLAFENITKLHYFRRHDQTGWFIPPIEVFVENLERLDAGGTCYTANSRFHLLLEALGFDVQYVASYPPMHMGNVVRLPEGRFYVDVGGGGPLFQPVNLATGGRQEWCGPGTEFVPKEGATDTFQFRHLLRGECTLEWELRAGEPLTYNDFAQAITRANEPGTLFMSILRCALYQPARQRALSLVNNTFTIRRADGTESKQSLPTTEAIEAVVAEEFGLPRLPVREAVETLAALGVDVFKPKE